MSTQAWTVAAMPGQQGRVAIVTGANCGIGFEQARALTAKGASVVIACRTPAKGDDARRRILAEVPQGDVRVMSIDTADLASVRRFAEQFKKEFSRLDLLINNAGVMAIPKQLSVDGFELQLATNHLGHFALTGLLLPLLEATPGSRVVAVSSLAARRGQIHFDDLTMGDRYKPWPAYEQSKLANLIFGLDLHRRLQRAGSKVVAVAAHPGVSKTNLFSTPGDPLRKKLGSMLLPFMFQPAAQGAVPILFAATAPSIRGGEFIGPDRFGEFRGAPKLAWVTPTARNEETARKLWEVSEQLTGVGYL